MRVHHIVALVFGLIVVGLVSVELAVPAFGSWWADHPLFAAFLTSSVLLGAGYLVIDEAIKRREDQTRRLAQRRVAMAEMVLTAGLLRTEMLVTMTIADRDTTRYEAPVEAESDPELIAALVGFDHADRVALQRTALRAEQTLGLQLAVHGDVLPYMFSELVVELASGLRELAGALQLNDSSRSSDAIWGYLHQMIRLRALAANFAHGS